MSPPPKTTHETSLEGVSKLNTVTKRLSSSSLRSHPRAVERYLAPAMAARATVGYRHTHKEGDMSSSGSKGSPSPLTFPQFGSSVSESDEEMHTMVFREPRPYSPDVPNKRQKRTSANTLDLNQHGSKLKDALDDLVDSQSRGRSPTPKVTTGMQDSGYCSVTITPPKKHAEHSRSYSLPTTGNRRYEDSNLEMFPIKNFDIPPSRPYCDDGADESFENRESPLRHKQEDPGRERTFSFNPGLENITVVKTRPHALTTQQRSTLARALSDAPKSQRGIIQDGTETRNHIPKRKVLWGKIAGACAKIMGEKSVHTPERCKSCRNSLKAPQVRKIQKDEKRMVLD